LTGLGFFVIFGALFDHAGIALKFGY
jgi:hypothetical protein